VKFLGDVEMKQMGNTVNISLLQHLIYYSEKHQIILIAKEGFISDLGSIPIYLRSFVRADNILYARSFIMHDLLYRNDFNRKKSDLILDEMLKLQGLGSVARSKIYYALRMFGSATNDEDIIDNAMKHSTIVDYSAFKNPINVSEEAQLLFENPSRVEYL
jgi:hypothetical protein